MSKDIIVLIGPAMSGKTTLCNALHDHFKGAILDWNSTADDISDAQAYVSDGKAVILTAQTMAEGAKKLEQLGLNAEMAQFFYLTRQNGYTIDQKQAVMTIDYHLTKQAEPYTSIKAGITMPVFVIPDDDQVGMAKVYMEDLKTVVQAEIDSEFEKTGHPAPYSDDPRGRLLVLSSEKLAAIIPEYIPEHKLPLAWQRISEYMDNHRIKYIRANAPTEYPGYIIVDCADGDLSNLPRLEYLRLYTSNDLKLQVLANNEADFPDDIKKQANVWWNTTSKLGLPENDRKWVKNERRNDYHFLDCTDGNFQPVRDYYADFIVAKSDEAAADSDDEDPDDDDYEDIDDYEETDPDEEE